MEFSVYEIMEQILQQPEGSLGSMLMVRTLVSESAYKVSPARVQSLLEHIDSCILLQSALDLKRFADNNARIARHERRCARHYVADIAWVGIIAESREVEKLQGVVEAASTEACKQVRIVERCEDRSQVIAALVAGYAAAKRARQSCSDLFTVRCRVQNSQCTLVK